MNPHPAIQMFGLCEGMKWSHLPVAGGIYDQDPELLRMWRYMFSARSEHDEKERITRERKKRSSRR